MQVMTEAVETEARRLYCSCIWMWENAKLWSQMIREMVQKL